MVRGKSTLVKTLAGEIQPLSGQRTAGEHLRVGYFHSISSKPWTNAPPRLNSCSRKIAVLPSKP